MNTMSASIVEDGSQPKTSAAGTDVVNYVVQRHLGLIQGICTRSLWAHPHLLDDALQTVLLIVSRKAPQLRVADPALIGWLYRCAANVCRNLTRRESVRLRHESLAAKAEGMSRSTSWGQPQQSERLAELDDALAELPEPYRHVLLSHYFEGDSVAQTAQEAGLTESYVKVLLHRGRVRLRKALARRGMVLSLAALVSVLEEEAKALPIADLSAVEGKSLVSCHWSVEECSQQVRTTADAVMTEMDRAARAMWWKVGGVAAGLATIGVGTALVVSHLQSATVESATSWRFESVIGNPSVRRDETMRTLKVGDLLCIGDTILTSSNQEVQVVSDAGDRVLLREDGEVRFEHPTSNIEHRTSKLGEGDSQVRVVYGAVVAKVKHPARFATAHAGIETDGADFFLMVANGLTTNGAPWSFTRTDVTTGSVDFAANGTVRSKSAIGNPPSPGLRRTSRQSGVLLTGQFVTAGTDYEGKVIEAVARKSDGREFSPKYGGVFFREAAEVYARNQTCLETMKSWKVREVKKYDARQLVEMFKPESPGVSVSVERVRDLEMVAISNTGGTAEKGLFLLELPDMEKLLLSYEYDLTTEFSCMFAPLKRLRVALPAELSKRNLRQNKSSLSVVRIEDEALCIGRTMHGDKVYECRSVVNGNSTPSQWERMATLNGVPQTHVNSLSVLQGPGKVCLRGLTVTLYEH